MAKHILIVDDDDLMRRSLGLHLEQVGYRCSTAASAEADLPVLLIDPHRIAQAIGNLISNAIKYTPAGGEVTVTAVAAPTEVCLKISDTGPGIEPEEQARIFEPFYRSQQRRRFPKGLGLGLTIAHDWVVAHNGRLTLDSTTGQGSHFTCSRAGVTSSHIKQRLTARRPILPACIPMPLAISHFYLKQNWLIFLRHDEEMQMCVTIGN